MAFLPLIQPGRMEASRLDFPGDESIAITDHSSLSSSGHVLTRYTDVLVTINCESLHSAMSIIANVGSFSAGNLTREYNPPRHTPAFQGLID